LTFTQLPNRKADAYSVDLRLEARETILDASPRCVTWDLHGRRLLYVRDIWRYRVIEGTDIVYDPGNIDTEVMSLPVAQLPLSSPAQGNLLTRIDRVPTALIPDETWPAYGSLRVVNTLAADPETGNFIVYSHRDDVADPYYTDLAAYAPNGGPLGGTVHLEQPNDGTPRWQVPHAILEKGWLYAIERDLQPQESPGPAPGHVVKRNIGTLGSLIFRWSPLDRYVYPHSVSVSKDNVWVATTKLYDPGDTSVQRTFILALDRSGLGAIYAVELNFGLGVTDESVHYWLGEWQAAGAPNSGGLVLFDGTGDDEDHTPTFIAAGASPQDYDPDVRRTALIRFVLNPPGVLVGELGDAMPIPMSRTPAGVVGNNVGQLPELRNL